MRQLTWRRWLRRVHPALRIPLASVLLIVIYYVWPDQIVAGTTASVVLFALCLATLGGLIAFLIWRGGAAAAPESRAEGLLVAVQLSLLYFAQVYHQFARASGWFDGIHTRTDALYFTLATAATVGYGDIHPVAQTAKIAVMVQIIFDLVFIGAAVSVAMQRIRRRRGERAERQPPASGGEADG